MVSGPGRGAAGGGALPGGAGGSPRERGGVGSGPQGVARPCPARPARGDVAAGGRPAGPGEVGGLRGAVGGSAGRPLPSLCPRLRGRGSPAWPWGGEQGTQRTPSLGSVALLF